MTPDTVSQLVSFVKVGVGHSAFYATSSATYTHLGSTVRICRGGGVNLKCEEVGKDEFLQQVREAFELSAVQFSQVVDTVSADADGDNVIKLFA